MMADTLTRERRSWNMSRIRGRDTGPELVLRSQLHRAGFRFRLHATAAEAWRDELAREPGRHYPPFRSVWPSSGSMNKAPAGRRLYSSSV